MQTHFRHLERWLLKFGCFLVGCTLTYFLQSRFHFSAVLAAALVGFLCTLIPEISRLERFHFQATIYAGTFVAMGSKLDMTNYSQLLVVSVVGTTLYVVLDRYFKGLGGKLGLIAFISTVLSLMLRGLA